MANIFARYWKTLAIASVSLTSTYFFSDHNHSQINNRLLSTLRVQAAEYERRNAKKPVSNNRLSERRKDYNDDDDDDGDDEDNGKENTEDKSDPIDENPNNIRERRFRDFASIEYNNEIFMTPVDFLESIISTRPRPRIGRRQITDEMVSSILYSTPPKHRGSKRFFRNLEDTGLISFSEYLFLWVILTKPSTQFQLAFAMFDTDGNQLVDKHEFLVLGKVMSDKRMVHESIAKRTSSKSHSTFDAKNYFGFDLNEPTDTTLLIHLFGKNGRDTLNYTEFKRFMEDFQTELLEIEFAEFSHGFKTISALDFTEILLRYTDFDRDTKKAILKRVKKSSDDSNALTFEQFKHFFAFLNNLEEFSIAMRFHLLSNKPISQAEFQRAARISTGFELESPIISLIFLIFDADDDQHLSYDEFMAVMKNRLSRDYQVSDYGDESTSKFDQFKRCLREQARRNSKLTSN